MTTETNLSTYEIEVSLNPDGTLHLYPDGDVTARPRDHIVWKSTVGDLVVYIQGKEEGSTRSRHSPFKKFLHADGRENGQGEVKVRAQVKDVPLAGDYKYMVILFDDNGDLHQEDPRIVIR